MMAWPSLYQVLETSEERFAIRAFKYLSAVFKTCWFHLVELFLQFATVSVDVSDLIRQATCHIILTKSKYALELHNLHRQDSEKLYPHVAFRRQAR